MGCGKVTCPSLSSSPGTRCLRGRSRRVTGLRAEPGPSSSQHPGGPGAGSPLAQARLQTKAQSRERGCPGSHGPQDKEPGAHRGPRTSARPPPSLPLGTGRSARGCPTPGAARALEKATGSLWKPRLAHMSWHDANKAVSGSAPADLFLTGVRNRAFPAGPS